MNGCNLGTLVQITQLALQSWVHVIPLWTILHDICGLDTNTYYTVWETQNSEWCSSEPFLWYYTMWIWDQLVHILVSWKKIWVFCLRAIKVIFSYLSGNVKNQGRCRFSLFWIGQPRSAEWQFWVLQFEENFGKIQCVQSEAIRMKNDVRAYGMRNEVKNGDVT